MLDALVKAGYDTYGVGKIYDIFAGQGIQHTQRIQNNVDGMEKTIETQDVDFNGICFVNLVITADHGCDPGFPGTDHTREHTPFLVYGKSIREDVNLGTRESFADIAATILDIFNVENNTDGTSMKEYILKK